LGDKTKEGDTGWNKKELWYGLMILYLLVQLLCCNGKDVEGPGGILGIDQHIETFSNEIADSLGESSLFRFLAMALGCLRWDNSLDLPIMHILFFKWKTCYSFSASLIDLSRRLKHVHVSRQI